MSERLLVGCVLLILASCSGNVEEKTNTGKTIPLTEKQSSPKDIEPDSIKESTAISHSNDETSRKLALIVAVGHYANVGEYPFITAESREWRDISSENDVPLIKAALRAQGFPEKNITVIEDKQATHSGIIEAIRTQLIDKVREGDIVVFHYSGHGQQIADDNNDELDGYDESIVPYDAAVKFVSGVYEGANHIRDDLLGALMTELRTKLGKSGHLLMVIDACHSGTATRGLGDYRGTPETLAPVGYKPKKGGSTETESFETASNSRGAETQELAPLVLISGSSADELNYETVDVSSNKKVGSLTYAFSRAMVNADPSMSYDGLFDKIRLDMTSLAPRQTPQMEGSENMRVLSGTAAKRLNHFTVKKWLDDQNITMNGGELNGLLEGTEVAFYDADADTAGKGPKATGKVVNTYFNECDVLLNTGMDKSTALNSWVYVTEMNFGNMAVAVRLDIKDNDDFKKQLEAELSKTKLIKIVMQKPDLVIEMNNKYTASRGVNAVQLVTVDDYTLYQNQVNEASSKNEAQTITGKVVSYAQAKFLRNIEMNNEDMKMTFEFVPVTIEKVGRLEKVKERTSLAKKVNSKGVIEFKVGDHFLFKVKNESRQDLYYCILDIQPDNVLTPLIPWKERTSEEYKLKAGETIELPDIYGIYEPTGLETIKLIATKVPIDLKPIVATRGASDKANSPLAKLLADSYKANSSITRGAATESVPPSSGFIHTVIFRIVKQ